MKVPGGPTRLSGALATDYRFYYGTDVVCMPDFFIDAFPVTIGAYRDWISRSPAPRQPRAWLENSEIRTRQRNPDLPVSGIIPDDGLRYAAGHDKRVPTPVEWARAGVGAKTKWMADLTRVWAGISEAQNKIALIKSASLPQILRDKNTNARNAARQSGRIPTNMSDTITMVASPEPTLDRLSKNQMQIYIEYWAKKPRWFPYQHSPVGFYPDDVSKWGVHEVVGNTPEMCQPNYAARTYEPAAKPYVAFCDPYLSRSNAFGWLANCSPGDMDMNYALFAAHPEGNGVYVYLRDGIYQAGVMRVLATTGYGFRCAL